MSVGDLADLATSLLNKPLVLLALVLSSLGFGLAARGAAARRGWPVVPSVLAACGLALAIAVTVARPTRPTDAELGLLTPQEQPFCLVRGIELHGGFELLNLFLLMPFAFFAVLATRRPLVVLALSIALGAAIELIQTTTNIGVCETQDFFNNTLGAAIAVLVAWLLNARVRRPGEPARSPHP